MELVPAQGEQTAQRDVKAVHGNVCYQDGILNCTDVQLSVYKGRVKALRPAKARSSEVWS